MLTNIRYILLTALRDWLFGALMIGLFACSMIAHILGSTALVETQEMMLAYVTASTRILIISGMIVFTCFHVRNAFETREIELFLSRPVTRTSLVFSYWLGFAVVSLLLLVPTMGFVALQGLVDKKGFLLWSLSLLLECWLTVAFSLLAAFSLRSAVTSILASAGVYVLGRLMDFFLATGDMPLLGSMAHIFPRLDLFAKSEWLVYGVRNMQDYTLGLMQAVLLIPLLVAATIAFFRRQQF